MGLTGWEREEVHVLAPAGTRRPPLNDLVLYRARPWRPAEVSSARRLHRLAPALVIAASSFPTPRPATGLLAAGIQQRLTSVAQLRAALTVASRTRHRGVLLLTLADIEQGAQALSEIDFASLCRRHGLPRPVHQAVRREPGGRRRYLDVEWRLPDGRRVAAEIDGALHLRPGRWFADQLRQNEIVIGGTAVLRFPSVVVRAEEALVADQLRRILGRR